MAQNTDLLEYVLKLVSDGRKDETANVVDFVAPEELATRLADVAPVAAEGATPESLKAIFDFVQKNSVRTWHPYFFNQLYGAVDEFGLAAAWLTEALNTNCHTYEVAPVFMVVEMALLRYVRQKFFGSESGDGIMCPGGSVATMYAMLLARTRHCPQAKTSGVGSYKLVAFASEEAHYSVSKGANWMGIGTDNVVKVASDSRGRMDVADLERAVTQAVAEGKKPFFVNATAGTTVIGAFDNFGAVSEVCSRHDSLWLHVDACWGGAAVLSPALRPRLLKGVHLADSVVWNAHKMVCAPLQASVLVTRHRHVLSQCNAANANYLFQQDKFYDVSYDTGDKSMQCGRKTDAFKVWFMLAARGETYLAQSVENAFAQASYLRKLTSSTPGFRPAFDYGEHDEDFCTNVCFFYVPERLRGSAEEDTPSWWAEINSVAPRIKKAMVECGSLMVGYQPLQHKGLVNFFRMVIPCLPQRNSHHMEFVVSEIDRLGKNL